MSKVEEQPVLVTSDPVEDVGFTLLASGGPKPLFDIVFVHGLQGHPKTTWTHKEVVREDVQNAAPESSTQQSILGKTLSVFRPKAPTQVKTIETYWPRDLLPQDFPDARIFTYGYASKISYFFGSDRPSRENLTENGRTFMQGLAAHRSHAIGRPLLIVTHSLGGLIVKSVRKCCC